MSEEHPARAVAAKSRAAVIGQNREDWLSLFADDARIEDPIGKAPTNPDGKGIHGKEAITRFWDETVCKNRYEFTVHESYAAGREVANHMTLHVTLQNGMTGQVRGVFTYALDDEGKISNLRGFWELNSFLATLKS